VPVFYPFSSAPLGANTYTTAHAGALGTGLQNY